MLKFQFGCTYSHISSVRSSVRMGPMRLCFFLLDITKMWPSRKMSVTLRLQLSVFEVDCSCVPHAVFRATSGGRNFCSRGPRGLKFFMHSHPLMGGRLPKFQKKIRRKKIFFVLLVPLTFRLITHVLRALGVWNLLCVLTPLMRDRLPHFCFKIRRKLFIFSTFSKKKTFIGEFPLLRLITSVLIDLCVWNLLCVFTSSRGTE